MRALWIFLLTLNVLTVKLYVLATTIVDRCPGIGVQNIRLEAQQYEFSFIFYYTSWSNNSLEARKIFNEVAQYYEDYYFAEIDCWHLACNCTRTHEGSNSGASGLPDTWPTMMVRYGHLINKMQYHGEWHFIDLIRFIGNMHRPIERLHTRTELKVLTSMSDAVVLGLFENADSKDYRNYMKTAVQWLQIDPNLSFRFAVAFGSSCEEFLNESNRSLPVILLINSNRIEKFNTKEKFIANEISRWLQNELKRSFRYISGYNSPATIALHSKSRELVLAIFANEMHSHKNFYSQMQQFMHASTINREPMRVPGQNKLGWQIDFERILKQYQPTCRICCLQIQCMNTYIMQYYYHFNAYWNRLLQLSTHNAISQYDVDVGSSSCLIKFHQRQLSLIRGITPSSPTLKTSITKYLKKVSDLIRQQRPTFGNNQTLSIVILNKNKYKDYLEEHFSVQTLEYNTVVAAIFDAAAESTFVMNEPFTLDALETFIANYYSKNLVRMKKLIRQSPQQAMGNEPTASDPTSSVIYLNEYNAQLFNSGTTLTNSTVVLLIESPLCALSGVMAHALTQVASLLRDNNEFRFYRLNIHTNTLPWTFVMPHTPALIVLPIGNSMESRIFPTYLRPTVRNIMGFILAQVKPVDQVKTLMQSCRRFLHQQHNRLHECLEYSRSLVMQHIGNYLKLWQIYKNERDTILSELKSFKDLGLDMQHSFIF